MVMKNKTREVRKLRFSFTARHKESKIYAYFQHYNLLTYCTPIVRCI